MLGERGLASQRTDRPFAQQLVSGFGPGAWLLSALTLAWTAPAVAALARRVLDIRSPDDDLGVGPSPWIAAAGIGLVTLTSTLAARLHHRAVLLFPTPWLAVLALSLVFASYGACWLGRVPLPCEFVLLWAGLAAAGAVAAAFLDRLPIRYSHTLNFFSHACGASLRTRRPGWRGWRASVSPG